MKSLPLALISGLSMLLYGCQTITEVPAEQIGYAELRNADQRVVGNAAVYQDTGAITISLAVKDLPRGSYAIHLVEVGGACQSPDPACTLNPTGVFGSLPYSYAELEGEGNLSTVLAVRTDTASSILFDSDGTSVLLLAESMQGKGRLAGCGTLIRKPLHSGLMGE